MERTRSKTVRSNNTSGVTGVERAPNRNKWQAAACFKGKRHCLELLWQVRGCGEGPAAGRREALQKVSSRILSAIQGPKEELGDDNE